MPPDLDTEERQEEFLLLLLALGFRAERKLIRQMTPELRRSLLKAVDLVDQMQPDGQFRIYDWARQQADLEVIENDLTESFERELPPVMEEQKEKAGTKMRKKEKTFRAQTYRMKLLAHSLNGWKCLLKRA